MCTQCFSMYLYIAALISHSHHEYATSLEFTQVWHYMAASTRVATHQAGWRYMQCMLRLEKTCWNAWVMEAGFKQRQCNVLNSLLTHRMLKRTIAVWRAAACSQLQLQKMAGMQFLLMQVSSWRSVVRGWHLSFLCSATQLLQRFIISHNRDTLINSRNRGTSIHQVHLLLYLATQLSDGRCRPDIEHR
jgi:hypothetical protein